MSDVQGEHSKSIISRTLRHPLSAFIFGALILFVIEWLRGPDIKADGANIHFSVTDRARIENEYKRFWGRTPPADELAALRDEWIIDEALYLRARQVGLDQDDPIIRRYLAKKMSYLIQDSIMVPEPSDEELQAYFQQHLKSFQPEPKYEIEHVRIPSSLVPIADAIQLSLNNNDTRRLSTDGLRIETLTNAGDLEISRQFGVNFHKTLATFPVGEWSSPVATSIGLRFIRIISKDEPAAPPLEHITEQVKNAWRNEKQQALEAEALSRLKSQFTIQIDDLNE